MSGIPSLAARCALAALLLFPTLSADAAPSKSGVVAGSGTSSGGVFTAGPDGADYALPSQARLRLAPDTSVRVFPVPQALALTPGAKTTTYSFALLRGRVDITVPSKPRSAVLASAGKLSVVVSAGEASLLVRGENAVVASRGGDVRTLFDERWQALAEGMLARFGGAKSGAPEPAIRAPELLPSQRLWFSASGAVTLSGFRFAAVARASAYEARLRGSDGAERVQRLSGAGERPSFSGIEPGAHTLSMRSIDADGLAGAWSGEESVRVLGVLLPPGGYVEGGDIFVGSNQEVRFSHSEGLEMTYQGAGRYVPASDALTLYRGEATVVSFRVPGSLEATTTRLLPRSIYADIEIGPRRALWPRDDIQIVVELKTKTGRSVPSWLELKPRVLLGIEPLEVSFTRDGNRLLASVPATDKPGPWVLRVEVSDQYGSALGRDFLEIAPERRPAPKSPNKPLRVATK
jgi:hypothetical protein